MNELQSTRIPAQNDPGPVAFSSAAYRLLLAAYPAQYRREYGLHMAQVFRDCCLRAYRQLGLPGMVHLWVLTLADWLKSALEQHLHKGVHNRYLVVGNDHLHRDPVWRSGAVRDRYAT